MELQYYDKELDLNGTAAKLCKDAYNGYTRNIEALSKIKSFLSVDLSVGIGSTTTELDLQKIEALIEEKEIQQNYPDDPFNIGRMKFNLLSGYTFFEDFLYTENLEITVLYEPGQERFAFGFNEYNTDAPDRIGGIAVTKDEFLGFTQTEFKKLLDEVYYYSMYPAEEEIDR